MHPLFVNPISGIGDDYFCKRLCPLRGPFIPYGRRDSEGEQARRANIGHHQWLARLAQFTALALLDPDANEEGPWETEE